jgi:hypothetical protein
VISELPTIRFTFDSPLQVTADQPANIRVSMLDGGPAAELGGTGLVGANALIADTVGPLPPGEYVASYTTTSIDGDFNEGEVRFSYDNAAGDATNCVVTEAGDGGSSAAKQALLLGAPIVVVGTALVMFNRWAKARTPDPA